MPRHPATQHLYEALPDGTVRVTDEATGATGVFAVGARWLSGDLKHADLHMIRYVHDSAAPQPVNGSSVGEGDHPPAPEETGRLRYLSQEWLDELRRLAADQPVRPGATVTVQYRAVGGPAGDIDYYWVVEEGKLVAAELGRAPEADVSITMQYEDTAAVQRGDLHPTNAFMSGKVEADGDMAKMMSLMPMTNSPEWMALQDHLRSITTY